MADPSALIIWTKYIWRGGGGLVSRSKLGLLFLNYSLLFLFIFFTNSTWESLFLLLLLFIAQLHHDNSEKTGVDLLQIIGKDFNLSSKHN